MIRTMRFTATKTSLLASLLIVVLALGFGAAGVASAQNKILKVGSGVADVGAIDPHFASNFGEYPIVKAVFNSLVDLPAGTVDMEAVQPELAESWSVSDDGLVWTFNLRKGIQFHHGYGEFTSGDVVFSLNRAAHGSATAAEVANIKEVRAVDRYTVEFELHAADPFTLLRLVGYRSGLIVSEAAVTALGTDHRLHPIGTGPFVFQQYNPRRNVVLTANKDYFKGAPKLDGIEFIFMSDTSTRELALRTGEVHTADGDSEQIWVDRMRAQGLAVDMIGPGNGYFLQFNMTKPPFDNLTVRQALAYSINRDDVVQYLGPALARQLASPVPSGYFGYTTDGVPSYEYNPAKSRQLLREAGYPNGFEFEIYISEATSYLPFAQIVQEHFRQVGVTMKLNIIDHTSFHARIRENLNGVIFYNASRLPIADAYLTPFYHSESIVGKPTAVTNFSHLGDTVASIDELLDNARFEQDMGKQLDMYAEAQRTIMNVVAAMPYAQRFSAVARQPNVVIGYELQDGVRFDNLFEHYIYNENTDLLGR